MQSLMVCRPLDVIDSMTLKLILVVVVDGSRKC